MPSGVHGHASPLAGASHTSDPCSGSYRGPGFMSHIPSRTMLERLAQISRPRQLISQSPSPAGRSTRDDSCENIHSHNDARVPDSSSGSILQITAAFPCPAGFSSSHSLPCQSGGQRLVAAEGRSCSRVHAGRSLFAAGRSSNCGLEQVSPLSTRASLMVERLLLLR